MDMDYVVSTIQAKRSHARKRVGLRNKSHSDAGGSRGNVAISSAQLGSGTASPSLIRRSSYSLNNTSFSTSGH